MKAFTFVVTGRGVPWARAGEWSKYIEGEQTVKRGKYTKKRQSDFREAVQWAVRSGAMRDGVSLATLHEGAVELTGVTTYSGVGAMLSRPDIDNLAKMILDALNGVVYVDDAQVVRLTWTKMRGKRLETRVTVVLYEKEDE